MKIWIACALLAGLAPRVQASSDLESGEERTLVFEAGDLSQVLTFRTTTPCSLYIWTQSDELDVTQNVQPVATKADGTSACRAGSIPAYFAEPSQADEEWSITLRASGAGTATFMLTEVVDSEALHQVSERAQSGLAAVEQLKSDGEFSRAHDRYREAVEDFLANTTGTFTLDQTERLWDLILAGRAFRDDEFMRQCLLRLVQSDEALRPPRAIMTATARWRLAIAHRNLRQLEKACEQLELLIPVLEVHAPRESDTRRNARCELGVGLARLGRSEEAEPVLLAFLDDYREGLGDGNRSVIDVRTALANVRVERRDLAGARLIYREVLAELLSTLPPLHIRVLQTRGNLANAFGQFSEYGAALREHRGVLADLEQVALIEDPGKLGALGMRGDALLQFTLHVRLNLAVTLQSLGRNEEAIALLEEIDRERRRTLPEGHPARAMASNQLASACSIHGDYEAALALALESLEELEQRFPPGHPRLLAVRFTIARSLMGLGRLDELEVQARACAAGARASLRPSLTYSARERTAVAGATARELKLLLVVAEALASQGLQEDVLSLIEAVRVTSSTSPRSMGAAEEQSVSLRALGDELRLQRKQLGELVAALNTPDSAADGMNLSASLEACDRAERTYLDELARAGLWYLEDVPLAELAAALPENACAVSFWRTSDWNMELRGPGEAGSPGAFFAQLLHADGSLRTIRLAGAELVLQASRNWRASIGRPFEGAALEPAGVDLQRSGDVLRELILDPLLPWIGDCTRVYVCLDDELHLVPLDALPFEGGYVGDRYKIRPLSFLSALTRKKRGASTAQALLVAGAVDYGTAPGSALAEASARSTERSTSGTELFEGRFGSLVHTEQEVREIAESYRQAFGKPAVLLLGREASKQALLRLAPGARYLHLATHGGAAIGRHSSESSETTAQRETIESMAPLGLCGLALAGANSSAGSAGILTGEELSGLDLSACELATLSACDTSVGLHSAGQGLGSLQAALQTAGAQTTLTSLWKVDDRWTRVLMKEFYGRLWSAAGPSPGDALWQAKRALIRRRVPLRDWAGWVLSGDVH